MVIILHVLVYDDSTIYGGQQLMGVKAVEALLENGETVTFLFYENNTRLKIELESLLPRYKNFKIISGHIKSKRAQALRLLFDWSNISSIVKIIRELNPGIILAVQGDIEIGSMCLLASRISGTKVISYIPFAHSAKKKGSKLAFLRDVVSKFIYKLPNAFITSSVSVSRKIGKVSGRPVGVVHDGIRNHNDTRNKDQDRNSLRDKFNLPKDKFLAAVMARIQFNHKGQDFLVLAAKQHKSQLGDVMFVIVGDGPDEKKLKNLIQTEQLQALFLFLPWQNNSLAVMNAIDLLVMPSLFEGVPLTMLEAMQRRCPILASSIDGMREILPGEMLYEPDNTHEFIRKLMLFNNNEIINLEILIDRNESVQNEMYSLKNYGANFISTFEHLKNNIV